jgi:hypothetical protein
MQSILNDYLQIRKEELKLSRNFHKNFLHFFTNDKIENTMEELKGKLSQFIEIVENDDENDDNNSNIANNDEQYFAEDKTDEQTIEHIEQNEEIPRQSTQLPEPEQTFEQKIIANLNEQIKKTEFNGTKMLQNTKIIYNQTPTANKFVILFILDDILIFRKNHFNLFTERSTFQTNRLLTDLFVQKWSKSLCDELHISTNDLNNYEFSLLIEHLLSTNQKIVDECIISEITRSVPTNSQNTQSQSMPQPQPQSQNTPIANQLLSQIFSQLLRNNTTDQQIPLMTFSNILQYELHYDNDEQQTLPISEQEAKEYLKEFHFSSNLTQIKNTECPISLAPFEENEKICELSCGHCYRIPEIMDWIKKKQQCTLCGSGLPLTKWQQSATLNVD